ncbi:sugar ABC transporter permease, partial [Vibrio parahaemolyticus]|nr:sugar ABC transporter permease [Vibrio parahaemolyticus]
MSIKRSNRIRLTLSYALILLVSVIIIYPLVWTVGASFYPGNSIMGESIFPENPTLSHYATLFANDKVAYLTWFWNSLKISFLTMVLTLISVS